jgi:ABC-type branched-subunit amino acid transport system substrate-binding protein
MSKKLLIFLIQGWLISQSLWAQPVPTNEVADFTFERGLELYRAQEYSLAYQRFARVFNEFPLNTKTTSAMLMATKSLYSQGLLREASQMAQQLIVKFPDSRYVADAQRIQNLVANGQSTTPAVQPKVFNLGVILPMQDRSDTYVRALFNGIWMAMEDYNRSNPAIPIRLVFRDSGGEAETAVTTLNNLVRDEHVNAIIGPLFSQEAQAAAEAAERNQVVLIAPVATDENVSLGKRFVFQASSTFQTRGKLIARYAIQDLRQRSLGVIYESSSQNESTILAFQEEVRRLGGTVAFVKPLTSSTDWSRLSRYVTASNLSQVGALYMPISGRDAARSIEAALGSLDQLRATSLVLGNSDWHDIAQRDQASRYRTAYTSDFWLGRNDLRAETFLSRYRQLTNVAPDELGLSYAGFDITNFIITQVSSNPNNSNLAQTIRSAPMYQGVARRFDFRNSNQNEAVFYLRYRNGEIILDK